MPGRPRPATQASATVQSASAMSRGGGRAAALVADDAQLGLAAADGEHGPHEVPAVRGEDPGGAQDHVVGGAGDHRALAVELAGAVGGERPDGVVLAPRPAGVGAVEHVVGRDVQERHALRRGRRGHRAGRRGVDGLRGGAVVLGGVDGGVGGGVDDDVGARLADRAGAGVGVGQVGLGPAEGGERDAARAGASGPARGRPGRSSRRRGRASAVRLLQAEPFERVAAGLDRLPPVAVVEIPAHGAAQALVEGHRGLPSRARGGSSRRRSRSGSRGRGGR